MTYNLPSFVPGGTNISAHLYSIQRDPRYFFPLPDTFWPDRWLIAEGLQESKEKITHNPNAFIPFSFGPSNCVGKNLAILEMRLLVCHIFQKLDLRFPDNWNPQQWEDELESDEEVVDADAEAEDGACVFLFHKYAVYLDVLLMPC